MRRVACFECEDAKKWEGYTELLWKEALLEPGDEWTMYKACAGELPTAEEAAKFDAIIIAGSHYSAYEQHEWIDQLMALLRKLAAQGTHVYGCCFGCQILARALGGSVGPNPDGNFVLTIEQIQPTQQLQQFTQLHNAVQQSLAVEAVRGGSSSVAAAKAAGSGVDLDALQQGAAAAAAAVEEANDADAGTITDALESMSIASSANNNTNDNDSAGSDGDAGASSAAAAAAAGSRAAGAAADGGCFRLIESHGDQVLQLPPGAVLLASSPTATNELWSWGPNILASQFHVEFDEQLVLQKIWATLRDVGRLNAQQAEESRRVLEAGGQMNASMLQVVKHFLRHGIDGAVAPNVAATLSAPSSSGNGGSSGRIAGPGDDDSSSSDRRGADLNAGTASINASKSGGGGLPGSSSSSSSSISGRPAAGGSSAGSDALQEQVAAATAAAAATGEAVAAETASDGTNLSGLPSLTVPDQQQQQQGLDALLPGQPSGGSGCSSPSGASERSTFSAATATASICSTSVSAVPFSHIAAQRRQQRREQELSEASQSMIGDAAAAFDMRMEAYGLDIELLQQLNDAAAGQYGTTAEIAAALGQFAHDLNSRQAAVRDALAALPQLDRQLKVLEAAVGQLDKRSKELESRLGLGGGGGGAGRSAYEYISSSFSRAGSGVGGAAVAAAGGCLGGGALPKQ